MTIKHTDEYGFYHHITNPNHMSSENPSLFSGGMRSMATLVGRGLPYIPFGYLNKSLGWVTHIKDDHANFSHDEMSGQYIGRFVQGDSFNKLPIIKWDSQGVDDEHLRKYWLHPRDIICYLIFRNNVLGFLLSPFYIISSCISFLAEREKTSGKCKHFYVAAAWSSKGNRIQSFLGRQILSLGEKLCKREHGNQPFIDIFKIYFKDKLHISHELIGEYYGQNNFSRTYYSKYLHKM